MGMPTENDWNLFATVSNADKAAVLYAYLCEGYNMVEVAQNTLHDYNDMASQRVSNITRCYGFSGQNSGKYRKYELSKKDVEKFVKENPDGCFDSKIMDFYVRELYEKRQKVKNTITATTITQPAKNATIQPVKNPSSGYQSVPRKGFFASLKEKWNDAKEEIKLLNEQRESEIEEQNCYRECQEAYETAENLYRNEQDEEAEKWYQKAKKLDIQLANEGLTDLQRMELNVNCKNIELNRKAKTFVAEDREPKTMEEYNLLKREGSLQTSFDAVDIWEKTEPEAENPPIMKKTKNNVAVSEEEKQEFLNLVKGLTNGYLEGISGIRDAKLGENMTELGVMGYWIAKNCAGKE